MQQERMRLSALPWAGLAACLLVAIGFWGTSITHSITHPTLSTPSPSPSLVHAIPTVVTQYPGQQYLTDSELCAGLAPPFNAVILDNETGYVLNNVRC